MKIKSFRVSCSKAVNKNGIVTHKNHMLKRVKAESVKEATIQFLQRKFKKHPVYIDIQEAGQKTENEILYKQYKVCHGISGLTPVFVTVEV